MENTFGMHGDREPARIQVILSLLQAKWEQEPELQFVQLLERLLKPMGFKIAPATLGDEELFNILRVGEYK
jgi:uncharacterized protein YihD (DUF1040 family)